MARYIHARGTPETNKIVGEKVQDLYKWFGQGIPVLGGIRTRTHMLGGLSVQAGLQGIPCISPELGGGGRLWEHLIITGVKGVRNILIMKDMIQDEPFGLEMKQYVAQESIWPKTCEGGFMYNSCELGDIVEKNECLGILKNVGGEFLEEINAPYKSIIFDTRFLPTVYPGDWTFHCGKID
jgi:predicted deacylase